MSETEAGTQHDERPFFKKKNIMFFSKWSRCLATNRGHVTNFKNKNEAFKKMRTIVNIINVKDLIFNYPCFILLLAVEIGL